jgi:hypothetical protein
VSHRLIAVNHSDWDGYWWGSCLCGWKTPGNPGYWGPLSEADVIRYHDEHVRVERAKKLAPHGTQAAIRRHERNREPLCEPCRLERNRLARVYHHLRRQRAQPNNQPKQRTNHE